ncbi:MAG TPA: Rrf2 family transcriptional regulator [Verrucomicrobiota bacterium]|nr:Rrf2 family transcriptional regulator [Verrucomicrobiota bacterium]HNT14717.1 Rrf2 family transcriptional regulator [Verrucomicrobiota bacterium]
MKLTVRGQYALRAMQVLARNFRNDDSVIRIQAISSKQKIPKRFLEQILNDLKSAGLVVSKRGVAGGYRLKRPPQQISLAEIIRHIEGPLAPVSCVSKYFYEKCTCPDEAHCAIRSVMQEVRDWVADRMETTTLNDLVERARKLEQQSQNSYDFVI